jgi:hypothetical protein
MKQYHIGSDILQQVFHFGQNGAELIAEMPGTTTRDKVRSAYVLTGALNLLTKGDPSFDDKSARDLCEAAGCYDHTNHTKSVNAIGNELAGSKSKGWSLTAPGLKYAAQLIKDLGKQSE